MAFFFALHRIGSIVRASRGSSVARQSRVAAALALALLVGATAQSAHAGTLVTFNTQLGTIQLDLFDNLVPETVANFLSYANSGAFNDTLVHRGDTSLGVIQGGGYNYVSPDNVEHIATSSPIALQYNRANSRGTIAMARQTSLNSATSEWFINTKDNTTTLGQGNNGGYAVFGWIVGKGLEVADAINALDKGSVTATTQGQQFPLSNVPLRNHTQGNPVLDSNLVFTSTVVVEGTHPDFQNPVMNTDVVNDGLLRVSDAHAVINDLLANGVHTIEGPFTGTNYLDVNGSGTISAADAHSVINALLAADTPDSADAQAAPLALPRSAPFAAPMFSTVPEPASLTLAAVGAIALAAGAFFRRRRR